MTQVTARTVRWTTADLELLAADEWKRYEVIDGELFVTRAPHWQHQRVITNLCLELQLWSRTNGTGEVITTPGILFTEADNVIPDVVWVSHERLAILLDDDGHLTGAPDLIVEVLSAGAINERSRSTGQTQTLLKGDRNIGLSIGVCNRWNSIVVKPLNCG